VAGVAASLVLLLVLPVGAGDFYPAPAFFADGLTARSSWEEILTRPTVQGEFPLFGFGATLVPLAALCADTAMLRIADPRLDNGVALALERVRTLLQARAGAGGEAIARVDRLAAAGPIAAPGAPSSRPTDPPGPAPLGYAVSVYRVFARPQSIERIFLFEKRWAVPTCPTR
jgi:hypothetical protein